MKQIFEAHPELKIPRSAWESHSQYGWGVTMPLCHIGFRTAMQMVLKTAKQALDTNDSHLMKEAHDRFIKCMNGLKFHVDLEEGSFFNKLQAAYPDIDLKFLYAEHSHLLEQEKFLIQKFEQPKDDILREIVEFDKLFMTHLGEEEDLVTPMCLMTIFDGF